MSTKPESSDPVPREDEAGTYESRQAYLLRRNRALATGMLVAAAAVFVVASLADGPPGFWRGLVIAAAEASIIGALADWFAITALFRRPLGLPIPHTAIVPRRKDRIAEGIGGFIASHFLDPDLVSRRLASGGSASRLGQFLADGARRRRLARQLRQSLRPFLGGLEAPQTRAIFIDATAEKLRQTAVAPLLARAMRQILEGNHHAPAITRLVAAGRRYLDSHEVEIADAVEQRTAWWVPRLVDRRMARSIAKALRELLDDLAIPGSLARTRLEEALRRIAHDIDHRPQTRAAVEAGKNRLLDQPDLRLVFGDLWDVLQRSLVADVEAEPSRLEDGIESALAGFADRLAADARLRGEIDGAIAALAGQIVAPWRESAGRFVTDVVKAWDTRTVVGRLELALGADLQYVRMSGTVVAAVIGSALYLLTATFD
ncbi:MAG: DUF445 domain-containing protein [Azospirillaceae bacterium]